MSKNSRTSLVPGVFRELGLLLLAVLFGSLPFVAAAQANPATVHLVSQRIQQSLVTAEPAAKHPS